VEGWQEAKTEQATPRRRMEARRDGQVAMSHDLAAGLILLAAIGAVWWTAVPLLDRGAWLLEDALRSTETDLGAHAARLGAGALAAILPMLLIIWVGAYLARAVQIGWIFSGGLLRPSWSRIDPRRGLTRLLAPATLGRWVLDITKVGVVVCVVGLTLHRNTELLAGLPYLPLRPAMVEVGSLLITLAVHIVAVLLLLGGLDLILQRRKYERELRMTRQQVRDELRHSEGHPFWRRRRRTRHAQISACRATSQVLIVGEAATVALEWDPQSMSAPRVMAKGVAGAAWRLRQMGLRCGSQIVEHPVLASALHRGVAPGQLVPPELYEAVARALAEGPGLTTDQP
jgi:flagellar biosynthetic protein FlhB